MGFVDFTASVLTFCPKNRYHESLRAFREWRHLKLLKRHGRGHVENGIEKTSPGSCAVECPACPQPGRNLPVNWRDCPPNLSYVNGRMVSRKVANIYCFSVDFFMY